MWEFLTSGLLLGLASSMHCAGMCGPLVISMPFYNTDGHLSWKSVLEYHFGKTMMYAILGAIFGAFGMGIRISGFQQIFSIAFGILLLLIVLGPRFSPDLKSIIHKLEAWYSRMVSKVLTIKKGGAFIMLGLTNGIIPCGMVYVALGASVMAYSITYGALFMVCFGLGTLPVLTSIIAGRNILSRNISANFGKLKNLAIIFLAVLFIIRGMNLGIPYLSPKMGEDHKLECCKKH